MEKNSRKQQADKTKETILKVVTELVNERPIYQITVREICKAAGISIGAFYHHFDSKEAAILYGYRSADIAFTQLELTATPWENIREILATHLGMVTEELLTTIKSVYISHLAYYDEYFFDEDRPVIQVLKREIAALTGLDERSDALLKLVWKVLNFCRGCIYNVCIRKGPDMSAWPGEPVEEAMAYMRVLVGEYIY